MGTDFLFTASYGSKNALFIICACYKKYGCIAIRRHSKLLLNIGPFNFRFIYIDESTGGLFPQDIGHTSVDCDVILEEESDLVEVYYVEDEDDVSVIVIDSDSDDDVVEIDHTENLHISTPADERYNILLFSILLINSSVFTDLDRCAKLYLCMHFYIQ